MHIFYFFNAMLRYLNCYCSMYVLRQKGTSRMPKNNNGIYLAIDMELPDSL